MATDTAATSTARVGIFGGAFDPVHRAHIALALASQQQLQLDKVLLVPCGNPPHRKISDTADSDRLAMLQLATRNYSDLIVDDWELHQSGTTYTYDTLLHYRETEEAEIFFLMGEDSLYQFTSWHNWSGILGLCHLAVARRPGLEKAVLPEELAARVDDFSSASDNGLGSVYFVDFEEMAISATAIRHQLLEGVESLDFVDPAVKQYIRENRLYQNA